MKKKVDGIPKAFEQYEQQEVDLILSMLPTHTNVKNLAISLGRSNEAIYTVFRRAYSGKWLRDSLKYNGSGDNIITKISEAKKNLGIFIGHEVK